MLVEQSLLAGLKVIHAPGMAQKRDAFVILLEIALGQTSNNIVGKSWDLYYYVRAFDFNVIQKKTNKHFYFV